MGGTGVSPVFPSPADTGETPVPPGRGESRPYFHTILTSYCPAGSSGRGSSPQTR